MVEAGDASALRTLAGAGLLGAGGAAKTSRFEIAFWNKIFYPFAVLAMMIVALPFAPPGVVTEFLYEEPFQVVVPAAHKWARRKAVQASELAGENTILLNVGHCFRDQVLDSCPELNRADTHVPRTNSLETIRNMVASGLGISVLPRDALTPKYHSRLVVPVPFARPAPTRRIALAYRRSFPRPDAVTALREAVAACRSEHEASEVAS